MTNTLKKLAVGLFAAIFAVSLAIPAISSAQTEAPNNGASNSTEGTAPDPAPDSGTDAVVPPAADTPDEAPDQGGDQGQTPAGDCVVTLEYYEIVTYEDPEKPPADNEGRRLLGRATLTGVPEGSVLDTWDVVVNIPGYFFFDAWPAKLTVSADPAQNVIKLFYVRLWNSGYTVNYYLMTGADLTADNWGDALATDNVRFTKMGSQTFTDQPFDSLVDGDAYEYKLDGTYVIDTYPAEIRLGLEPDDNVINVLYTPESTILPDDVEVPDGTVKPPAGEGGAPSKPTLPGDTTLDKDDLITVLPDDVLVPDGSDSGSSGDVNDFLGPDVNEDGTIDITDEMLSQPVNKAEAQKLADAYRTGVAQGSALAQTGDSSVVWIVVFVAIAAAAIVGVSVLVNRRHGKDEPTS